jgi:Zn-finger protein
MKCIKCEELIDRFIGMEKVENVIVLLTDSQGDVHTVITDTDELDSRDVWHCPKCNANYTEEEATEMLLKDYAEQNDAEIQMAHEAEIEGLKADMQAQAEEEAKRAADEERALEEASQECEHEGKFDH